MKTAIFALLMCICLTSSAGTVFIKDEPYPLKYNDNLYYWPQNLAISPGTKNLFITMDGIKKVCFLNQAPSGLFEQVSEISILIKGFRTEWNCFPYTTTITKARP